MPAKLTNVATAWRFILSHPGNDTIFTSNTELQ